MASELERINELTCKVLVMDDEPQVLQTISAMLSFCGSEVIAACEGRQAVGLYRQEMKSPKPFDMVILDLVNREGPGGKETLAMLLEIDANVKAMAMSAYSSDPVIATPEAYGFAGSLAKPFTMNQIVKEVTRILNVSSETNPEVTQPIMLQQLK